MGVLRIMSSQGDTTLTWDPEVQDEVEKVEKSFDDHRLKGFMGYRTIASNAAIADRPQVKGETITKFDPKADEIVMTVPLRGG